MRRLLLCALLSGCGTEVVERTTIIVVPAETSVQDTRVVEDASAPPLDTASASDTADTAAADTVSDTEPIDTEPTVDAGPDVADTTPRVTWSTRFPDATTDTSTWRSDRQCAQLDLGKGVSGGRTLPYATAWRSFSATVNVEADLLTCPEMIVRFAVGWDCATLPCANVKTIQFKVAKAVGITTYVVAGDLVPAIVDPLTPGPKVRLGISQYGSETGANCGRLDVWPGAITFSE